MTKNIATAAPASSSSTTLNPPRGHSERVNRRPRFWTIATVVTLALGSATSAFAQGLPPQRPNPTAPLAPPRPQQPVPKRVAPPPAAPPAALPALGQTNPRAPVVAPPAEPTVEVKAMRGVVIIERAGQVLGLGTALSGDGRILTALSPLGSGNDIDVKFADGKVVRAKLGHHDRMWDLALLVPQTGKWTEGLTASTRDPVRPDATIRSYSTSRGKVAPGAMVIRGRRTLLGADDVELPNALELGSRVSPLDLGSPIIDEDGRVVSLLVRGCAPNEGRPCTPVAFGVPINAIRSFLKTVPATAVPPSAWLGIEGVADVATVVKGVRVQAVQPNSPAAEAKLVGGDATASDLIVAVDGAPVTTPESLVEAIRARAIGDKVPLLLFGQGKYRQVTVVLRQAPDPRTASEQSAVPAELPALGEPSPRGPVPPKSDLMGGRR